MNSAVRPAIWLVVCCVSAALLSACGGSTEEREVRVIHLAPETGALRASIRGFSTTVAGMEQSVQDLARAAEDISQMQPRELLAERE